MPRNPRNGALSAVGAGSATVHTDTARTPVGLPVVQPESRHLLQPLVDAIAEQLRRRIEDLILDAAGSANEPERPMSLRQFQEYIGVSGPTLAKLRVEGLPVLLVGDTFRIERERALAWLRKRGQT